MKFKPYWQILATSARENSVNPRQIVVAVGLSLFRMFLLAAIYAVAYKTGHAGLGYANIMWSLAVYAVFILNLALRDVFKAIEQDVQSGDVEAWLVKPLDWRLVKLCQTVGKNSVEFVIQLVILPIFLLLIVGLPDVSFWSPQFLLSIGALTILAMISACSLFMMVGLATFWLSDAKSLYRVIEKTVVVLCGAYIPIALLPSALQAWVRYSPFGVYAAPTQAFNSHIAGVLTSYLVSAVCWTAALLMLNTIMWRRAQLRIEANGG